MFELRESLSRIGLDSSLFFRIFYIPYYRKKGDDYMVTLTILAIILVILLIVALILFGTVGAAGLLIFGDLIAAVFVIWLSIKLIRKNKK